MERKNEIVVSITTPEKSLPGNAVPALRNGSTIRHTEWSILLLPPISIATLRYQVGYIEGAHQPVDGAVTEAAAHLARRPWQHGGRTAWFIAEEFQHLYFGGRITGFRRSLDLYRRTPRKGFDLIRAIDETGAEGVTWFCDIPSPTDWRHYETVRLKIALSRLAAATDSVCPATGNG